jgi:hypothetical protein
MQIFDAIDKHLRAPLSTKDRNALCEQLLTYAFRGPVSVQELSSYVARNEVDFDLLSFRKDLASNGDILVNAKTYLYSKVAAKVQSDVQALKSIECGLPKDEAQRLLKVLNQSNVLVRTLRAYARKGYRSLRPHQLTRLASEVLCTDDYERCVGSFVYKRMRFLIKSFGYQAHDLIADIRTASLFAVFRTYPAFSDYTHVLRLAKITATNTGKNILSHTTTASRQRLSRTNEPMLVPLHLAEPNGGANFLEEPAILQSSSYLVVGREGNAKSNDELDTMSSLNALLVDERFNDKQRRFLYLMMGKRDAEFSAYLGKPNEDAIEKSYDRYLNDVCTFLSIKPDQAQRFLRKLAAYL